MSRDGGPSRRSIIDATARLVVAQGVEGIRIRQVAAEAGLSTGAVLYHFPDQDALLLAVHEDAVGRYLATRRLACEQGATPFDRITSVARAGVPPWADRDTIRLFYEMHGRTARNSEHAGLLARLWTAEHSLYVDLIEAGIASGDFVTEAAADVATQLLGLEDGLVLQQVSENPGFDGEVVVRMFTQAARVLLGIAGPASAVDGRVL
ncbi:MAG TPA: TetR/AcrR family transcriptional regulator [Microbacterium sp.]|uniref:TetR/AcrR family transcriptional regulator n=1 Tax=Microbacterium sp. TaxID=51671 RepID=UPI002B48DC52|nr:TetR/AcrR family transcriptional regulator [Microbacterium sp.]HKT56875.1 TetR/AcrR family transcriptional regulator [Microbacterium sp.]